MKITALKIQTHIEIIKKILNQTFGFDKQYFQKSKAFLKNSKIVKKLWLSSKVSKQIEKTKNLEISRQAFFV